jgi:hypothetical protein
MALAQMLFTWRFVPETKGKTLEEIESMWDGHVANGNQPAPPAKPGKPLKPQLTTPR